MIPKILHCCWFGGPKTRLARKCRASWERFAPDWEVREWTIDGGKLLVASQPEAPNFSLPSFVVGALKAKKWAVVSDWARMKALYEDGGVYLDFDVELIREFCPPEGEWVAGEWTASGDVWKNPGGGIALEKGSPVAASMLNAYARVDFDPGREMMPWINERLDEAGELRILSPEILSPIDTCGHLHATEATLGIHRYALSWGGPKRKILQWMSWHGMRGVIDLLLKIRKVWRERK